MTAAWVSAVVAVAGIVGLLVKISFQLGSLIRGVSDHIAAADRIHADQEKRIRQLERRPSGGHF